MPNDYIDNAVWTVFRDWFDEEDELEDFYAYVMAAMTRMGAFSNS